MIALLALLKNSPGGFGIFCNCQKNKKVTLQIIQIGTTRRYTLAAQGPLEVPRGAQHGQQGQKALRAITTNSSRL